MISSPHANILIGIFSFIGIAGFWKGIPSLFRYRPALKYRPVTDFYGIPAEGYLALCWMGSRRQ